MVTLRDFTPEMITEPEWTPAGVCILAGAGARVNILGSNRSRSQH